MKAKCPFNPIIYLNQPIGMFHCPWCGEMVLAGVEHPDYGLVDWDEEEYKLMSSDMEKNMNIFEQNRAKNE